MTLLHPRCSNCSYHNEDLVLGRDKINDVPCSMCRYPLSEDDCFD